MIEHLIFLISEEPKIALIALINYKSSVEKTKLAFVPPKPKLLDITVFIFLFNLSLTIGNPSAAGSSSSI